MQTAEGLCGVQMNAGRNEVSKKLFCIKSMKRGTKVTINNYYDTLVHLGDFIS